MTEPKNFAHLDLELLVQMLDPGKNGAVSLDRFLALGNKLENDRSVKNNTMLWTGIELLKASVLLALVILVGIFAFIEVEYDQYEKEVEKNLLFKAEIELALPVRENIIGILNLTSNYDRELDSILRPMWENYTNVTLWDQLEDNGFVSTFAVKNPWIFETSAWFVFTIITTIGYGEIVPITKWGRLLVIFYSIPSIMSMAYFIKMLINCYERCPLKMGSVRTQVLTLPVIFFLYLYAAGWLFHFCEGWSVAEGVYYTWVTISTIGFGDYTIGEETNAIENVMILTVIINGLFMFSYAINVAGNLIQYIRKREQWNEIFSLSSLNKIELMSLPLFSMVKKSAKKTVVYSDFRDNSSDIRQGKTRRF